MVRVCVRQEIQDTVLRLVRTADQLVHSDQYRGGEAVRKRLVLVDEQSEKFMLRLDARRKNLSLAVTFYLLTKTVSGARRYSVTCFYVRVTIGLLWRMFIRYLESKFST